MVMLLHLLLYPVKCLGKRTQAPNAVSSFLQANPVARVNLTSHGRLLGNRPAASERPKLPQSICV